MAAIFISMGHEMAICRFFGYLHNVLHGLASPFYSFNIALGGDALGIIGYYLMGSYNLLIYFFDDAHLYIGIMLIFLLKVGSMGAAMEY